jgi:hypothetical protein
MKEQFVHLISCFTIVKWPLQPLLDKKGVSYGNVSDRFLNDLLGIIFILIKYKTALTIIAK